MGCISTFYQKMYVKKVKKRLKLYSIYYTFFKFVVMIKK